LTYKINTGEVAAVLGDNLKEYGGIHLTSVHTIYGLLY